MLLVHLSIGKLTKYLDKQRGLTMFFAFPSMESPIIKLNTLPDKNDKFIYTKYWICSYFPGHPDGEHLIRYREQVFTGDELKHKDLLTNTR